MVVPQLLVEICRITFTVQAFVSHPATFWALTLSWRRAPIKRKLRSSMTEKRRFIDSATPAVKDRIVMRTDAAALGTYVYLPDGCPSNRCLLRKACSSQDKVEAPGTMSVE